MKEPTIFTYQRRYGRASISDVFSMISHRLKYFLLTFISRTWLKKRMYPGDYFYLRKWKKGQRMGEENEIRNKYPGLELNCIKYFDAVAIDDFDRYENVLLTKFKDDSRWKTPRDREDFKMRLGQIKTSMDSVTYGGEVFYFKFGQNSSNDLLDSAHISYIKTFESYFILSIEIQPSKKFKTLYADILMSDDSTIETDVFNTFRNIVKTGIFVSHTSMSMTSIGLGLKNLMEDLTHQVKKNVSDRFRGMFFKAGYLPRVEYYEVGDILGLKTDTLLMRKFGNLHNSYCLEDERIYILPSSIFESNEYLVRVIKEKDHGRRDSDGSDLTDYDWVETHYLLQSLSLPATLIAILSLQKAELNSLKRLVYDYINGQSKASFFKKFLFLRNSRRYADLKLMFSRCILTFKRAQEEFTSRNLKIFSRDPSLDIFKKNNTAGGENIHSESDLQEYFQNAITSDIETLNKRIELLEHVFKPIEDLSVYRTNFWLQIISIFIAVVALVLTLDKLWQLITYLID